ncbi:MAG: HD domain-containing protein [Balneolaceae bacterium]
MPDVLKENILIETEKYVREQLEGEGSGHDWWHIHRVRNMALSIAKEENADVFIVELAALLHDIADHKFHDGDETIGPKVAGDWLATLNVNEATITHVKEIISDLSFKGANVATPMRTIEGKIVQDADRIDAIGAIGIARAFAYGGHKNRELFNPDKSPTQHNSFDAYKNDTGPTINHFYEKLFLLKERMNTQSGRKIAKNRHSFMEDYVNRFYLEWDGNL